VSGAFLEDGYLFLECELDRIIDDLDQNSIIIGRLVAAKVATDALRSSDQDDQALVKASPLLAYLYPDRFAEISASNKLPFPAGYER
jgi:hypothetical protein